MCRPNKYCRTLVVLCGCAFLHCIASEAPSSTGKHGWSTGGVPTGRASPAVAGALPDLPFTEADGTGRCVGHFCTCPSATLTVAGFRLPPSTQRIGSPLRASRMVVELRYQGLDDTELSGPTIYWDSQWVQPDASLPYPAQLVYPFDFQDCTANFEFGFFACTLNEFVGRPGLYRFHAVADMPGGSPIECTFDAQLSPPSVVHSEPTETVPYSASRLETITVDGSQIRTVHLYGSSYDRGFAHGYLLAEPIVVGTADQPAILPQLLTWGYRSKTSSHLVYLDEDHETSPVICYNTSPEGQPTIRDVLAEHMVFPPNLIAPPSPPRRGEIDGMIDGIKAKLGLTPDDPLIIPLPDTLRDNGTVLCPAAELDVTPDDFKAINILDDFCRSFSTWGSRLIDGSDHTGQGALLATTIEWSIDEFGAHNYLFVHHASPENGMPRQSFVHVGWAGLVVAYSPLLNAAGVATAGIMSGGGRRPFGGTVGQSDVYWYELLSDPSNEDDRYSLGAQVRSAIELPEVIGAQAMLDAVFPDGFPSPGFFTSHATTFAGYADPDLGDAYSPVVAEVHWREGNHFRTAGNIPGGPTMSFPYYGSPQIPEDRFVASTFCGQFTNHACNMPCGDPEDCTCGCYDAQLLPPSSLRICSSGTPCATPTERCLTLSTDHQRCANPCNPVYMDACSASAPCSNNQACTNGSCHCQNNDQCPLGQTCETGRCRCDGDGECPVDQRCRERQCVPACTSHEDCRQTGWCDSDGLCSLGPYCRADDYNRLGVQFTLADRLSLSTARRILRTVAEVKGLLQFVVLLPNTKEMLVGTSQVQPDGTISHAGNRINQVYLRWQDLFDSCHSGDVNDDGQLSAEDAQQAFYLALNWLPDPTFDQFCRADCNGDNEITAGDAQCIFFASLGSPICHCQDSLVVR